MRRFLTWTLDRGIKGANCIRCFSLFGDSLRANCEYYLATYGVMPSFKGGGHCGEAVVTEVGQVKSEFVYHGDVLNTTARLTGLCSQLEEDFLISGELAAMLPPTEEFGLVDKGEHMLKGKAAPVDVKAVRFETSIVKPLVAQPSEVGRTKAD